MSAHALHQVLHQVEAAANNWFAVKDGGDLDAQVALEALSAWLTSAARVAAGMRCRLETVTVPAWLCPTCDAITLRATHPRLDGAEKCAGCHADLDEAAELDVFAPAWAAALLHLT